MSATTADRPRSRINPEHVIALLVLGSLGCLAMAVVQVVAALGPALLAVAVAAVLAWLVKVAPVVVVPLPALGCVAGAAAVSPWFLLGALACLAARGGGRR